jgi:5-methylcytosine-specific restriction protein A
VRGGRCELHRAKPFQRFQRDQAIQRLYNTARWKRRRAEQLAREPWCAECLQLEQYTPATDADHIERHNGDLQKFFSGKLQSLCHAHHSRKTAEEVGFTAQGRGAKNVLARGDQSEWGQPREINSQCGESS